MTKPKAAPRARYALEFKQEAVRLDALRMAWFKRHPAKDAGLIFHSDRGSQYASKDSATCWPNTASPPR